MKNSREKILMLSCMIFVVVFFAPRTAHAAAYDFVPNPYDLYDLYHYSFYTWGINWTPQSNEVITNAYVRVNHINNWEEGDAPQLALYSPFR